MITRASRVLLVLLLLISSLTASVADSAKDMLAAGRIDEAITELNGRLSSAPADAESSNLLCRAYFALEEWDRAESSCRKAVSLDQGNGRYHLWMGRVYGEKADRANFLAAAGLAGKVRGEFERAVQLDPKNLDARLDLAEFYLAAPGIVGGGKKTLPPPNGSITSTLTSARVTRKHGSTLLFFYVARSASMRWSKPSSSSASRLRPNPMFFLKGR